MDSTVVMDDAVVIDTAVVIDAVVVISFENKVIVLLTFPKFDTLATLVKMVVSSPLAEVAGSTEKFTTWFINSHVSVQMYD